MADLHWLCPHRLPGTVHRRRADSLPDGACVVSTRGPEGRGSARPVGALVAHLVQERGVIETLRDKEIPPGGDYEELKPFLAARIPDAGPNLVDHAVPLVVACGVAIAVAMSFGVAEFQQAQTQVKLAGELVGREGRSPNPEIREGDQELAADQGVEGSAGIPGYGELRETAYGPRLL